MGGCSGSDGDLLSLEQVHKKNTKMNSKIFFINELKLNTKIESIKINY